MRLRPWAPWLVVVLAGPVLAQGPSPSPTPRPEDMIGVDDAHGDREFLLLWPEGAPGALGRAARDKPKITVYRAPAASANGAAVVVCPGGGYRNLASDHEGRQVAEWLNSLGVSAFVLQYRGTRPLFSQDERMAFVSALGYAVHLNDGPGRELIDFVRPPNKP